MAEGVCRMSRTRIVVTGAAGFIGSHLTDRLVGLGHEVLGIDSFEDYYPRRYKDANIAAALASDRFTLIEENILALGDRLDKMLAGADCVVHLAAQAGVRASWGKTFSVYTDNNVLATQVLLEAVRRTRVAKFVYASSSSVYGDTDRLPMREDAVCRPVSPYGVTKLAAEHLAYLYWKNHAVPTVALRFFTVYGPRQRPDMAFHKFIRAMIEGQPLELYGTGDQTRDFTFVSDIVDGLLLAMKAEPGGVYNLGGGSRVTLLQALATLREATGLGQELDRQGTQPGDVRHTWADLSRAHDELGYQPRVSLAEGLAREAEWLRALLRSQA